MKKIIKLSQFIAASIITVTTPIVFAANPITKDQCPTTASIQSLYATPSALYAFDDNDNNSLFAVSAKQGSIKVGSNIFFAVVFENKILGESGAVDAAINDVKAISANYPIVINFDYKGKKTTVCSYSPNFEISGTAHSIAAVYFGLSQ